jgi:competence protein ComEC
VSRRRRPEEDPPAPLDLRLVIPAVGAWLATIAGLVGGPWAIGVLAASLAGVVGLCVVRGHGALGVGIVALAAAGLLVALLRHGAAAGDPLVEQAGRGLSATVTGTVSAVPQRIASKIPTEDGAAPADRWRVQIDAGSARVAQRDERPVVDVTVFADDQSWSTLVPGQQVSFSGRLAPDTFSVLPAVTVSVRASATVLHDAPAWQRAAAAVRSSLRATAAGLDPDPAGLLPGLVVGDTSGLSDELTTDARTVGLTHLLAVSGSHFVLVCGGVVALLRRWGRRPAAIAGVVVLVALVVLVGPQPSVIRAAVMCLVLLVALVSGRENAALPALGATVLVVLLTTPELALSAGFALSVLATGALITLSPRWSRALQHRGWPPGWADTVCVPAAAAVATMPVIVALSGAVSWVTIPANLLAAPVVAPALLLGLLCAAMAPWWPGGAHVPAVAASPLLSWIAGVAHRLAAWPSASLPWPATPMGIAVLVGALAALIAVLRRRRGRALLLAGAVGAGAVLLPAGAIAPGWPPSGWVVVVCEVGQGMSYVLSTDSPGVAVVVDTGPKPAPVDDCLDRLGIGTVPLLVLTHLHADHVGGLRGALDGRAVGRIGVGPDRDAPAAWSAVLASAATAGAPVVELNPGDTWGADGLRITVLGPSHAYHDTGSGTDENNDSVVLLAEHRGLRVLLTGDAEELAQRALIGSGADLHADVLGQPHHGSATFLPGLLAAVSPRISLIGVGKDNDYGHPAPSTLAQLTAAGVTIGRTDTDGDVAVLAGPGGLQVVRRGVALPEDRG